MAWPRCVGGAVAPLLLASVIGCSPMTPPTPTSQPMAPGTPALHRWELPNGLVVLFQEDRNAPLVALEAVVKTGSATEGPWVGTGVSHVVEHMLFKGTATRPVGAIEREVKSYGGQMNAHTTYDYTGYTLTVHREHFAQALALLADALQHPSFEAGELVKELEVVYRELKLRRDDPDQYMADLVWASTYRTHPYRHPIVGYEPLLKALTRDDIVRYYHTHYLPNRTVLAIAGDAPWPAVREAVARVFEGWPRGLEPSVVVPAEPPPVAPRFVEDVADVALAQLVLAFPSVSVAHPDLAALDTLARILGDGRGSRLDLALRERGVVHAIESWNYTPRDPGVFAVTMRLDAGRVEEAISRAWEAIRQIQREPVTAAEVAAAKRAVIAQYLFGRQTVGAQAGDLATNEALVSDPEFSKHYVEQVQAVTAADVHRAAQQYLQPLRVTQVVVRPRSAMPAAAGPVASPTEAPMEMLMLRNGTRVLVREDHRLPIVTLRVVSLGGVLFETPETNGVATLAARMLLRGTASRSATELAELMRSLGGELASISGRNSVGVSLGLLSQDVVTGIGLLNDLWFHPAFPADEFLKEQRLLLAEIAHAEDDLFSWGSRRMFRALFPDHPYGWPTTGTTDSVRYLSVAQVAAFHRRLQDPRRTVLSVFGDIQRSAVLPLIERAFGEAPAGGTALTVPAPSHPLTTRQQVGDVWPRAEAIVLLGFRGVAVSDPDAPVFDALEMILGGSGGRLFTEVRERQGQAYTVGVSVTDGVVPGSVVLYAVTAPEQADAVVAALFREVTRLRTTLVSTEELTVAQRAVIGGQSIQLQTNGARSLQASLDELYGLGWQASRDYPAKVQAVTPEAIRRVAQRYLTPEACVLFVGRPQGPGAGAPAPRPAVVEEVR